MPTEQDLEQLATFHEPLCLSLYAPFIEPNTTENPVRIEVKNMLREAEAALLAKGASEKEVKKTLRPIRDYMEQNEQWPRRHKSLVFFSHPKIFRHFHVPDSVAPYLVKVADGFEVTPLRRALERNEEYYVLTLGHKNVRLYEGDRYHLEPVSLDDFPSDMKKALRIDEYPRAIETHRVMPANRGKGSEAYHEQYDVSQTDKTMLGEFFRLIDRRLRPFLLERQKPLVIAGVDYLLPIYKKANTYPGLVKGTITGNQEHANKQSLQEKAWGVIKGKRHIPISIQ